MSPRVKSECYSPENREFSPCGGLWMSGLLYCPGTHPLHSQSQPRDSSFVRRSRIIPRVTDCSNCAKSASFRTSWRCIAQFISFHVHNLRSTSPFIMCPGMVVLIYGLHLLACIVYWCTGEKFVNITICAQNCVSFHPYI